MKGQDKLPSKTAFDVYLTRGTESLFSKRYLTDGAAKRRCKQLDDVWSKAGWRTHIEPVEIKPYGPEI